MFMREKILKYIKNPLLIIPFLGARGMLKWLPDKTYLKIVYRIIMSKKLDIDNPHTFNEKIQWLKLYDRKPLYTQLVDKYAVREYIANTIGEEYLIPILGVWDRFDEIDFSKLPERFVLKCTHDSGSVIICKDKNSFDIKAARKKITKCLKRNYYWYGREWPYQYVKPRITAEKYMIDESIEQLKDYKIFCMNGQPIYIEVDYDRYNGHKLNVYDLDWNFVDFYMTSPNDNKIIINKPKCFSKMIDFAKSFSKNVKFVRIDFYCVDEKLYFGEFTFHPGSGFIDFHPKEFDKKMGDLLKIN